MKVALVGNPNSGKTTLFNELTGSSQHVGNWPGVTVEKKEGRLKKHKDVTIVDLPGIYSLSPYSLEEEVARDYLVYENPDLIVNIVDASNLERNLYLTTQLIETGIPVVVALNMMDVVQRRKGTIEETRLAHLLSCPVVPISAAYGKNISGLVETMLTERKEGLGNLPKIFDEDLEKAIEEVARELSLTDHPQQRYFAVKALENDEKALATGNLHPGPVTDKWRAFLEERDDDDMESIITNGRYDFITTHIPSIYQRSSVNTLSGSDKIDRIVTNRWLALPIFLGIMWFVYYVSISTVGDMFIGLIEGWTEGIQEGVTVALENAGASEWAVSLVINGIIGGVGAVFTFVPQLMILFFFLSLLEDSGYMARVAFIMDRIFRRFGLSGKSFIPMLIGTGCSIPGVMASRTIENESDRKMTILLTPFIPCGAKLPVFALFIGMIFNNAGWVGPLIYLLSIVVIIFSGILLKKTKYFRGDPAPFVMELPPYKIPRLKGVAIHMWEKAKGFVKKAGTIIFLACAVLWFFQSFNFRLEYVGENIEASMLASIGEVIRYLFIPLGFGDNWAAGVASLTGLVAKEVVVSTFATVGSVMPITFSKVSAFSFIIFTMFAAPCFAAIGAMHREFGSGKATLKAIGFQTGVAYVLAMIVNQVGSLIFAGTSAVEKVTLEYGTVSEFEEADGILPGDVVLYFFAGLILLALVIGLARALRSKKTGTPVKSQ